MPLKLPRFQYKIPITKSDYPTEAFHQWWQEIAKNLETSFGDMETVQADILAAQADITAAQADIVSAQADIELALRRINIGLSATQPTSILTASDAGTDATITIAGHNRIYGDGTVLAITGGSLMGLAYTTTYAIYYDDVTLADGTPTFVATTTLTDAQANKVDGRHFVGQITTPASGGGGTSGSGPTPPGGGGPYP